MKTPIEIIADLFPELITYDNFNDAIIGVGTINQQLRVVYDEPLVIEMLQDQLGLEYLDAVEYFEFNISGMYVGANTPLFFTPVEELDHE